MNKYENKRLLQTPAYAQLATEVHCRFCSRISFADFQFTLSLCDKSQ